MSAVRAGGETPVDAVVVGAGSVGVPIAWRLAEAGLRVRLLDGGASPGQGAAKAAIGGVRATHGDPAKVRVAREGLDTFPRWREDHGDDLDWRTGGSVFVAYREAAEASFKRLLEVQRRHGLDIDWLEPDALLERVPDLRRDGLRGGTFSPGDGHCSTPLAGLALHGAATRAGVDVRFGERVVGLDVAAGCVRAARTDLHEAAITEPVAPFLRPLVVDVRPGPGSANAYFYQSARGHVLFCLTPDPPIWGDDLRATSGFLPQAARRPLDVMPRLRHLPVRRTWGGVDPMTADGSPLIGASTTVEGLIHATGLCGQGFMLGPGVGSLVARLATGKTTSEGTETLAAWAPQRAFRGQEALR